MLKTLADGFAFTEGPRWHEGKLWFSDMYAQAVLTVDLAGNVETAVQLDEMDADPSGLGWLPDGRLLIVSMKDRSLLRQDPGGLTQVADLSGLASFHCNDMVVDAKGRAYIGNFGFDLHKGASPAAAEIVLVTPEGDARVVADEMMFPNGTVITPDGSTLIVGESFGARLTAFDLEEDGSLANRRVWAQLEGGTVPDGICLDEEGAVWVASPTSAEVVRVSEGGRVEQRIAVSTQAFACMLGGEDRRTLFVCTAATSAPEECLANRTGRIEIAQVEVAGAGWP